MKILLVVLFLATALARGDFADDQYADHSDILLRIITAAEQDAQLRSSIAESTVCYLRKAEYTGPLNAKFGTVHVAQLFYVRSAPRGSKLPARGHTYVVFFDKKFKMLASWPIDLWDASLSVNGAKLMSGKTVVFDYTHLPPNGEVVFDDKVFGVPK